ILGLRETSGEAGADAAATAAVDADVEAGVSTSGDGGSDAVQCACPGRAPCGVRIVAGAVTFCIDPTEVTEGAYAQFVTAKSGQTLDAGAPCPAVTVGPRNVADPDLPVTMVSMCEARAYCAWAGKSLCGATA